MCVCVRDAVGPRRPAPQAECGDSVTNDTFKILAASLHSAYSSDVSALVVDVLSLFVVIVQGLLWVLAKLRRACGCGGMRVRLLPASLFGVAVCVCARARACV